MTMWHAVIAIAIVTGIRIVAIVVVGMAIGIVVVTVAGCRFIVNCRIVISILMR